MPKLVIHLADGHWDNSCMRFRLVVDCQPLCNVLNGRTALQDETYRPLFRRLAAALDMTFRNGWQPMADWEDPVVWRKREWNGQADHLVNKAMDTIGQSLHVYIQLYQHIKYK